MARMGIFSRNDTTPDSVPRSLQLLTHRHSFDARYMEIIPNFSEVLYPNESISLQVTNFVRSIPMIRPMMSRVRVIQRFCAVPLRILWHSWEDYIKGENESQFLLEEPYVVNATDDGSTNAYSAGYPVGLSGIGINGGNVKVVASSGSVVSSAFTPDTSTVGISSIRRRGIVLTTNSYVPIRLKACPNTTGGTVSSEERHAYFKVGVHELGDYFGAPLYVSMGKVYRADNSSLYERPFSAFKFAAYQLAYSYFERQPNVQTRVDDFYEMSLSKEFPSVVSCVDPNNKPVPAFTYKTSSGALLNAPAIVRGLSWSSTSGGYSSFASPRNIAANIDESSSTYRQDVIRSSWENVEKFPLKSGANLSMLAMYNDPATGLPTYVPSNISLTRMRFANWQTDYFTSCNPWQQRGEEAQIPVSGSTVVSLDGVTFNLSSLSVSANGDVIFNRELHLAGSSDTWHDSDLLFHIGTAIDPGNANLTVDTRIRNNSSTTMDPGSYRAGVKSEDIARALSVSGSGTSTSSASVTANNTLFVSPSNFRFAMTLQHIKEMQAQIDNRYQSYIHKFFGARARDYRLDRPEFLGGSVMELNVSDVNQTSETTDNSDLGEVAGKSVSASSSRTIRFHADEHCVILGTLHIIPDTEYIGGLDRIDSTRDRFDWALPQFSHLSEQAVYNYELSFHGIFGSANQDSNDEVFGYEPIMNHLRWRKNFATGAFRDTLNSTGAYAEFKPWLVTRDFGARVSSNGYIEFNQPTLSDEFLSGRYLRDNSNFNVVDDENFRPFKVDSYFRERLVRVISTRGVPSRLGA